MASPSGGLAAFLTEDLTRQGVLEALRSRRVYATNGPRIVLDSRMAGRLMGAEIDLTALEGAAAVSGSVELQIVVVAPGVLDRVDVIRSGQVHFSVPCDGERECSFASRLVTMS